MKYYIYKDNQSKWRWTLYAANNEALAVSSESYWNKTDCLYAIGLVKASHSAPVYER